jgi:hypothetical protein
VSVHCWILLPNPVNLSSRNMENAKFPVANNPVSQDLGLTGSVGRITSLCESHSDVSYFCHIFSLIPNPPANFVPIMASQKWSGLSCAPASA